MTEDIAFENPSERGGNGQGSREDAPTRCLVCGNPIEQPATGRTRKYCSQACRQQAFKTDRSGEQYARSASEGEGPRPASGADLAAEFASAAARLTQLSGC